MLHYYISKLIKTESDKSPAPSPGHVFNKWVASILS
jgi:hypothetical protein